MRDPTAIVTTEMVPEIDVRWAVPAVVTRWALTRAQLPRDWDGASGYGPERTEQLCWLDGTGEVTGIAWVRRDVLARVLFEPVEDGECPGM